jgi:hypothetical protein
MPKPKTIADEVFDSMERKGSAEKNGEFRTARNGEVQPVWAMTQLGKWLCGFYVALEEYMPFRSTGIRQGWVYIFSVGRCFLMVACRSSAGHLFLPVYFHSRPQRCGHPCPRWDPRRDARAPTLESHL